MAWTTFPFSQRGLNYPGATLKFIARGEFACAVVMLDGRARASEARDLCEQAFAGIARDAMERLAIERARQELAN